MAMEIGHQPSHDYVQGSGYGTLGSARLTPTVPILDGMGGVIDGSGRSSAIPMTTSTTMSSGLTPPPGVSPQFKELIAEMGANNFEVIRFPSYRTACKLRFLQKKTKFYLVDLWNMIEAIRENGLHAYQDDMMAIMSHAKLEALVTSLFYQLNKRLPPSQHINLDESISMLLSLLKVSFDPKGEGRVLIFAVKAALTVLCTGKLIDKLRYLFSLMCDGQNNFLIPARFDLFLQEMMALTSIVFESNTYRYDPNLASTIFDYSRPVNLVLFTEVLLGSPHVPAPECIEWLPILDRIAESEHVVHHVACDACNRASFTGLRYKCQRCFNYTLCQDCFWRGRCSLNHNPDTHPCKEYTVWKPTHKQLAHSVRKSFRCAIGGRKPQLKVPEEPPRSQRVNLAAIVPPSPLPSRMSQRLSNLDATLISVPVDHHMPSLAQESNIPSRIISPIADAVEPSSASPPAATENDEHRLIAKMTNRLAKGIAASMEELNHVRLREKQRLIAQLEARNRQMMKEILRLRQLNQESEQLISDALNKSGLADLEGESDGESGTASSTAASTLDPVAMSELVALRERKNQLESQLNSLHQSRRDLMVQLEALMKLLKNQNLQSSGPSSLNSTLNRSTFERAATGRGSSVDRSGELQLPLSAVFNSLQSTSADATSVAPPTDDSFERAYNERKDILKEADTVKKAMKSIMNDLKSNTTDKGIPSSLPLNQSQTNAFRLNGEKASQAQSNGEDSGRDIEVTPDAIDHLDQLLKLFGEETDWNNIVLSPATSTKPTGFTGNVENYLTTQDVIGPAPVPTPPGSGITTYGLDNGTVDDLPPLNLPFSAYDEIKLDVAHVDGTGTMTSSHSSQTPPLSRTPVSSPSSTKSSASLSTPSDSLEPSINSSYEGSNIVDKKDDEEHQGDSVDPGISDDSIRDSIADDSIRVNEATSPSDDRNLDTETSDGHMTDYEDEADSQSDQDEEDESYDDYIRKYIDSK